MKKLFIALAVIAAVLALQLSAWAQFYRTEARDAALAARDARQELEALDAKWEAAGQAAGRLTDLQRARMTQRRAELEQAIATAQQQQVSAMQARRKAVRALELTFGFGIQPQPAEIASTANTAGI